MKDQRVWVEVPVKEFVKSNPKKGWYHFIFSDSVSIEYLYYTEKLLDINDTLVTHVLISKPIKEVIQELMPSEEEIYKKADEYGYIVEENTGYGFIDEDVATDYTNGINWLKSKLLGE